MTAFFIMVPAMVSAQNVDSQLRVQGYVFLGVGSGGDLTPPTKYAGSGGEVLLYRGLGVGGELEVMGSHDEGAGLYSIDSSYHFFRAHGKSKLVPFIEGGYTRAFGNYGVTSSQDLFNFGGGIHYWVFKHVGLRLEFRDFVAQRSFFGVTDHYWGFRVGLALRE